MKVKKLASYILIEYREIFNNYAL